MAEKAPDYCTQYIVCNLHKFLQMLWFVYREKEISQLYQGFTSGLSIKQQMFEIELASVGLRMIVWSPRGPERL